MNVPYKYFRCSGLELDSTAPYGNSRERGLGCQERGGLGDSALFNDTFLLDQPSLRSFCLSVVDGKTVIHRYRTAMAHHFDCEALGREARAATPGAGGKSSRNPKNTASPV